MPAITSHDLTLYRYLLDTLGLPGTRRETLGPFGPVRFAEAT